MSKYVKNDSGSNQTFVGQLIADGSYHEIGPLEEIKWANDSDVMVAIGVGDLIVAKSDDGTTDFANVSGAIDYLKGNLPTEVNIAYTPAFAAKTVGVYSLYTRTVGKKFTAAVGSNTFTYAIPYPMVKLNGIEVVNCEAGDTVDLKVLDDTGGNYTGTPNYMLNQFGFEVGLPKDFYHRESQYDADLYGGMQIQIEYTSASAKDVWINYLLHEVK